METTDTGHLLHDLTNSVCAMVGAADTLAAHHDRLTPTQRESLAACLHRQSDILRTLAATWHEAGLAGDGAPPVERPDARDTMAGVLDLVSVDGDGVVIRLRDPEAG